MCKRILIAIMLCLSPFIGQAQIMDESRKVDTLTFWQRVSLRTNMPDWLLGVPNIGGEFDIRKENWNRWSAGFNIRWRPGGMHSIVKPFRYHLFEVTLEGREYWRERRATPYGYLSPHCHWWQKILSCRNMLPSHPKWIFYRGGYISYSHYSMMFGDNGRQGDAVMTGFTWGFVKPFLAWRNGMSLDWEFGFSAGVMLNSYDPYTYDQSSNAYVGIDDDGDGMTDHVGWHVAPMLREIHAALVLRIGNYPMQKKYRWRYDVDMDFRERKDACYDAWLMRQEHKFYADSVYREMYNEFRVLYDSCVAIRHVEDQTAIDRKSPQRVIATASQRLEDSLYYASSTAMKQRKKKKEEEKKLFEMRREERRKARIQERYARKERESAERIKRIDEKYRKKESKL